MACKYHTIFITILIVTHCLFGTGLGRLSSVRRANFLIQRIIEDGNVKSKARSDSGKYFASYKAVSYRTQGVVGGTDYFVKVRIGDGEFIHLKVFLLPHYINAPPSLSGIQTDKAESDPIEYF